MDAYAVDFYCSEAKLIVEVDGEFHLERHHEDARRTACLERRGDEVPGDRDPGRPGCRPGDSPDRAGPPTGPGGPPPQGGRGHQALTVTNFGQPPLTSPSLTNRRQAEVPDQETHVVPVAVVAI